MKLVIILSLLSIYLYTKNIIWDKIADEKVILFKDKNSFATIMIIEEEDGERCNSIYFLMNNYNLIDISEIEQKNLMAIGINIKNYDKVKTTITKWIDLNNKYIITFLTVVTKGGKELSAKQPLIIEKVGKVFWR